MKTTHAGTQLATANRANSGNLIELKAADFKPTIRANLDFKPVLGTFAESETHLVSIENIAFSITGKFEMNETTDMDLVYALVQAVRTRGYKALFYNVTRTATPNALERDKQLLVKLTNSHYDTTESQTGISFSLWDGSASASGKTLKDVYHLHVRFFEFVPVQMPNSRIITYTLTGVTTK